jgi:hypothetical protein
VNLANPGQAKLGTHYKYSPGTRQGVTREAGMICEIAENRAEGMGINGGGLLK